MNEINDAIIQNKQLNNGVEVTGRVGVAVLFDALKSSVRHT